MPVELRKRKARPEPAPVLKKAAPVSVTKSKAKAKAQPKATKATKAAAAAADIAKAEADDAAAALVTTIGTTTKRTSTKKSAKKDSASAMPAVGSVIALADFGGEIETNDGKKTTLKNLVEASKAGVVLFTYPKASTPGCTRQACMFRDQYEPLTSGGLAIYGLSTDSPKANTTFQTNQNLPYPLLCDPEASLIGAIGLKKEPKGTTRGVFVVDKAGKVLAAEPGSPEGTVEVVKKLVEGSA